MSDTETISMSEVVEIKDSVKEEDLLTNYSSEPVDMDLLTIKQQRNKLYHMNFMNKHKDKINEKVVCEICFGSYTYFNKSKHYKGVRHLRAFENFKKKNENP